MLKPIVRVLGGFCVAFLATACLHAFANLQTTSAWRSGQSTLNRVAVLPFSEDRSVAPDASAGALVTRYMTEALAERGMAVIPASDVQAVVDTASAVDSPVVLGKRLREKFGVDSVLFGRVQHYEALVGSAAGAKKPARVGFDVTLYRARDGEKLLHAVFDERQVAASQNLLLSTRYPGAGSRWLSVEELARWGSEEVAKAIAKLRKGKQK